jgi:hypothetical protein
VSGLGVGVAGGGAAKTGGVATVAGVAGGAGDARAAAAQSPKVLRHFDLYRLDDPSQLEDIDYFGLLEDECAASLVEWGTRFADELPLEYLSLQIETLPEQPANARLLHWSAQGQRGERLLAALSTKLALTAANPANSTAKLALTAVDPANA